MNAILPPRIFDCIYGQPGSGKSELARAILERMYEERGLKSRIVVGDGSMLTYQPLIDAGICEAMDFCTRPWPSDVIDRISKGWWIADPQNPYSELVAPTRDIVNIGAYVFEGMSVAAAYMIGSVKGGLADRAGRGEKLGQDSPIRIVEADIDPRTGQIIKDSGPGTTFGGNPPSHYNIVQRNIVGAVQNSKSLSPIVIWTAHEMTNDPEKDALNKELLVGPEVIGKAMTGTIQRLFTNTLHAQSVATRVKEDDTYTKRKVDILDLEYRVYTRDHFNAGSALTVRYKACTRGVDETFPQYFTGKKPGDAVIDFYTKLSEIRNAKTRAIQSVNQ